MKRIGQAASATVLVVIWMIGAAPALARGQHIVIFGATGAIGGVIAQEALSRGDFVTGVARDTGKNRIDDPHYKVVMSPTWPASSRSQRAPMPS
jgi:NADPH-dependent curcumin reductase CurA